MEGREGPAGRSAGRHEGGHGDTAEQARLQDDAQRLQNELASARRTVSAKNRELETEKRLAERVKHTHSGAMEILRMERHDLYVAWRKECELHQKHHAQAEQTRQEIEVEYEDLKKQVEALQSLLNRQQDEKAEEDIENMEVDNAFGPTLLAGCGNGRGVSRALPGTGGGAGATTLPCIARRRLPLRTPGRRRAGF